MAALGGLILYASIAGAESSGSDPSAHLLIVPDTAGGERALAASDVRVIADYEEFALVEARGADEAELRSAGATRRDDLREVNLLGSAGVDPLTERLSLAAKGVAEPDEALVLVQFVGPIKDAWLERLRATGARIVEYVAQNGYIVHAAGTEVDRLAGLVGTYPAVRAVTRVRAADKLSDELGPGARMVAVQTVAGADGEEARREAAAAGDSVRPGSAVGELRTQFLRLTAGEVETLAADPAVVTVSPYSLPKLADERASQIVAGNVTSAFQPSPPGYLAWHDSQGIGEASFDFVIDFTDEGFDNGSATNPEHDDFHEDGNPAEPSRVAYVRDFTADTSGEDCGGHGTNVASIAAGYGAAGPNRTDGDDYRYGMGVAPRARIGASKVFACNGVATIDPAPIASEAWEDGARISNNSWGNQDAGGYSADSQDYDGIVRDAHPGLPGNQPMVEVFAAGNTGDREDGPANEGYGSINSPGTAKNVITVGASENVRSVGLDGCGVGDSAANSARDLLDYSSRGPTDDLRQKPDVVAPGTHMVGARPAHGAYVGGETCIPNFNPFYSVVSGTSQATAAVSGVAALVRDDFQREGRPAPSPALTKALLMNSATDLAGGSNGKGATIAPAPNADQGWGRVNAGAALGPTPRQFLDQSFVLPGSGTSFRDSYGVVNPGSRVKVTLAWTDAPGVVGPGPTLANNLDLVVSAGGRTYLGNVMAAGSSRVGGSPDTRNNVESVVLPAGTSGRLSVKVGATNIARDGVPGNTDTTDQDFALVVSNAGPAAPGPQFSNDQTALSDAGSGADRDGALEPGESVTIAERIRNEGDASAGSISGKLAGGSGLTVTQGNSAFGGAPAGGTTSSASPYAASLSASAACGADAGATLSIASSGGTQAVPLTLSTGAVGPAVSSTTGSIAQAIPDESSNGVASTVNVGSSGRIKDVDVVINSVAHPWVGDLALELRHPDGTTVELARHPGGPDNGANNLTGTVFDDEAPANIAQGAVPYTGRFRPQNDQLSRFDGKDKLGAWTLRVKDLFEGQTGTLLGWGMSTRSAVCDYKPPGAGGAQPPAPVAPSFALAPVEERVADAVAGRMTVVGACASACSAGAKLSVSGKAARSLGLTKRRSSRPVAIGTGSARRGSAGQVSYRVRLTKGARAAVRRQERVTASLSVTVAVSGAADVKLKHSVRLRNSAGLSSVARNGLRVRAACSRTCPFQAGLWVSARTARKLGLRARSSASVRVASRRATVSARGRELKLKMGRSTRSAAARQKRLSASLRVVAGPSSGPARKASRSLTLRR